MNRYFMKAITYLSLIVFGLASVACEQDDENYAWLLTLPAAAGPDLTEEIPVSIDIHDVNGDGEFVFDSTREIEIYLAVIDPVGPVTGSEIRIYELANNQIVDEVRFRAATDANGNVQGSITVNRSTNKVLIEADYAGRTIRAEAIISYVDQINRTLNILLSMAPVVEPDTDGDGIIDRNDMYPLDATRATTIRYPSSGYYTVAFEDLYPRQGDADFNDYVVQLYYEEDLDASGKLSRLRGEIQHIARGAGYKHTLHLTLPGMQDARLILNRVDEYYTQVESRDEIINDFTSIEIMPRSDTTLNGSNTRAGQSMAIGHRTNFEVIAEQASDRHLLGNLPYDLHLRVINTGHKIHFAGRYQDSNGNDAYLDAAGFPWALMIPGSFQWPLERRNIHNAYPDFESWYTSAGSAATDWYTRPVSDQVFNGTP